jgi:hypothetical protein
MCIQFVVQNPHQNALAHNEGNKQMVNGRQFFVAVKQCPRLLGYMELKRI